MEAQAIRGRWAAAPWQPLWLALAMAGGLLVIARMLLGLLIQYPAPAGDSVLFASVAHYHCSTGRFETPIFPLDPSGGIRYVWHGIGHPALLSWLSPVCGATGLYVAQILIWLAAAALAWVAVTPRRGRLPAALFALVVVALLSKQGFRPETTATLLALLTEWLRARQRTTEWTLTTSLLAWVQPTTFLLYGAYVLLSTDRAELQRLRASLRVWLPLAIGLQGLLWAAYPFPLPDLLQGLAQQGRTFAGRSDGSSFNYLIRSDFFPLFGMLFAAVFLLALRWRLRLLLLLPLLWFYGWRVPPTYYNLVPVFCWLLLALLLQEKPSAAPLPPRRITGEHWLCGVLLTAALLGVAGLLQSVLRDANSWVQYGGTRSAAQARFQALTAQGYVACEVPPHFTLMLPADAFAASHAPRLRACDAAPAAQRRDLVPAVAMKQREDASACEPWPARKGLPGIERLFRSDSGYSFHVCPAQPVR